MPVLKGLERAKWLLSPIGRGRIPFDYDKRTIHLIEKYHIQRKYCMYDYDTFILSWSGNDDGIELSRLEVMEWLEKTGGKKAPKVENYDDFLSVPQIAGRYGIRQSKVRSDMRKMPEADKSRYTRRYKGNKWLIHKDYVDKLYRKLDKSPPVDILTFQPEQSHFLPLSEVARCLDVSLDTVRSYVRRRRSDLTDRRFIRKGSKGLELHVELAQALWGNE